jgi:hypothetical protein
MHLCEVKVPINLNQDEILQIILVQKLHSNIKSKFTEGFGDKTHKRTDCQDIPIRSV